MRSSIRISLLLLLAVAPTVRAADGEDFVIYEAQHHSADELKAAAAGVTEGARVSSMGSKVVIYGTRTQREAVLKLFQELDHPLRNFVVKVRVAGTGHSRHDARSIEGAISGTGKGAISASWESGSGDTRATGTRQLVVPDGGTGRLYEGGGVFAKSVTVHLRSIGKAGAHVEIRELDANAVGEHGLVTEIDLPLGEWRTVSAVTHGETGRRRELLGKAGRSSAESQEIQLRVEAEPEKSDPTQAGNGTRR